MHTNGTFKHNCKQRPERHAQALHWISILCLCVTKERRMAGGFPTSFQFRFPMFDTISRTAVTGHGELMVARLLGTHLNFGVPLCYALLLFWQKLHTFSCRPACRPILHMNLHKQMQFRIEIQCIKIKTASARAFSQCTKATMSQQCRLSIARDQTWKEQTTAIEMRKIGGRNKAIHQTFFPRAVVAVCKLFQSHKVIKSCWPFQFYQLDNLSDDFAWQTSIFAHHPHGLL